MYNGVQNLIARVIVHPEVYRFSFYVTIEEHGKERCRLSIYNGQCTDLYFADFFFYGKWKSVDEFVITGKEKDTEIHILVNECRVEYINLTKYNKPPSFEMMRADISEEEREIAHQDWLHSLPPADAAIIRQADN